MTVTAVDDDPFTRAAVRRDRWGRPYIKTPGGKEKPYTRCTTLAGCLEDTYNLNRWVQRQVAVGLARRADLVIAAAAHHDDKTELDRICDAAAEAARSSSKATIGTALHRFTERLDRGEDVTDAPLDVAPDLVAYLTATAGFRWQHIEAITVNDDLQVAGTPDRVGVVPGGSTPVIVDLKTGNVEFGMGKIAMQLAIYAHSELYDPATGDRRPHGADLTRGIVIHLPAGEGRCELLEVDLVAGWEAVQLAVEVRAWRSRKGLAQPFTPAQAPSTTDVGIHTADDLARAIDGCQTVTQLRALWRRCEALFDDALTDRARLRAKALTR